MERSYRFATIVGIILGDAGAKMPRCQEQPAPRWIESLSEFEGAQFFTTGPYAKLSKRSRGQDSYVPLHLPFLPRTTVDESVLEYLPKAEDQCEYLRRPLKLGAHAWAGGDLQSPVHVQ